MRLWIDDEPSYFLPKATLMYFSALEGRNTAAFCPFMQNLPITEPPDQLPNLPKLAPDTIVFVLYEDSSSIV